MQHEVPPIPPARPSACPAPLIKHQVFAAILAVQVASGAPDHLPPEPVLSAPQAVARHWPPAKVCDTSATPAQHTRACGGAGQAA